MRRRAATLLLVVSMVLLSVGLAGSILPAQHAAEAAGRVRVQMVVRKKVVLTLNGPAVAAVRDSSEGREITVTVSGTVRANTNWVLFAKIPAQLTRQSSGGQMDDHGTVVVAKGTPTAGYDFTHQVSFACAIDDKTNEVGPSEELGSLLCSISYSAIPQG